ncbi:hypothetical protein RDMS_12760 [Deinococcus sp. RL]|uniref:NERD domain-containing protein n=1 Tax=Deinococcus sp. RL TaxID=1489678 RepID=UPI0004DA4D7A|nr:NERD domain-containing protein [Deinococcus sp. RL]KEF33376.1 hypothetical protein RDMS_12760 [Deinococcus sp. RL]
MATLYYGNNGVVDLKPGTLDALRRLPKGWDIILNLRPANGKTARELDAVIVTERAVHVLEFKRRKDPITIVSDSRWMCNGRELRNAVRGGESPAEQVYNSDKAFQEALTGKLAKLRPLTLPWVVLENFNAKNRIGSEAHPMPIEKWHDTGWVKVIHGTDHLETLLSRREEAMPKRITDADAAQFRQHFGAKPLGQLTVQGVALVLDSRERLGNARLKFTTMNSQVRFEVFTDEQGGFELQGMPLEPFDVAVPEHPNLRVLPDSTFKAHTELLVLHLFLVRPQVSEERIRELLQSELAGVKQEVEAVLALAQDAEKRVARLEASLEETRQSIAAKLAVPGLQNNEVMQEEINGLAARVEQLERERRQAEAVSYLDTKLVLQDALEPLQLELTALTERINAVQKQLVTVGQVADQAQQDARQAYRKAAELEYRVEDVYARTTTAQRDARDARQTAQRATEQASNAAKSAEQSATSARQAQGFAAQSAEEARRAAQAAASSREVQQDFLDLERTKYLTEEDRRTKRSEALKLSVIVGAAGCILSMQPLPFADNVLLAPMQIWLVVRIGQMYGQSVTQDAALKLLGTLGFGFAAQHATVALYKLVPGLTFGLGPFTVFGFTVLLGAMTAMFYERGRMPGKSEQRAVMNGIRTLLKDKALAADIRDIGTSVAAEFKTRGYKTRPEDFQAIFSKASERAKPIGERLERELFGKSSVVE